MPDKWMIKSHTFVNCNCAYNCGCQFNLPSTHGFCDFVEAGELQDGYFNDVPLKGLRWGFMIKWPGEIAEGNGRELVFIDERANERQRQALAKIVMGDAGNPGTNHFSVFRSTCSEILDPIYVRIDLDVDIEARTARLEVPGYVTAKGAPIMNEFSGEEFHIGLARPKGSFEFTHAEIGTASSTVTGPLEMKLEESYGQFCVHHYDQDGLVKAA